MAKSKNAKWLAGLTEYCLAHPEERGWQALRNWSEYSFILAGKGNPDMDTMHIGMDLAKVHDTFYD